MTCGNCARHVTEALQGVSGVQSANRLIWPRVKPPSRMDASASPDVPALVQAVEAAGYGPGRRWTTRITTNTAAKNWPAAHQFMDRRARHLPAHGRRMGVRTGIDTLVSMVLVSVIAGIAGFRRRPLLSRGVESTAGRAARNMDTPGRAGLDHLVCLLAPGRCFPAQAATFISWKLPRLSRLVSVGHGSNRASVRASSALRKLRTFGARPGSTAQSGRDGT
jgi:hypothetical protein